jgi:hypothetical protein
MSTSGKDGDGWRSLYLAAVHENDRKLLPRRIAEARTAIRQQARKLLHSGLGSRDERQALDRALYALNSLLWLGGSLELTAARGGSRQRK